MAYYGGGGGGSGRHMRPSQGTTTGSGRNGNNTTPSVVNSHQMAAPTGKKISTGRSGPPSRHQPTSSQAASMSQYMSKPAMHPTMPQMRSQVMPAPPLSQSMPLPRRVSHGCIRSSSIPRLCVQPETPLPTASIPTPPVSHNAMPTLNERSLPRIATTANQSGDQQRSLVGKMHNYTMTVSAVSSSAEHSHFHRNIKHYGGDCSLQCVGMKQVPPMYLQDSLSQLSAQQIQGMAVTPAPSDVSSVSPRVKGHMTPRDHMTSAGHMTPDVGSDVKHSPLMPDVKQESWSAYRMLPAVCHAGDVTSVTSEGMATACMTEQTPGQSNFLLPEISPSGSFFTSPRHSARQAKKRAMSTSTLSSEGLDLLSLIRSSPSALLLGGSLGSPPPGCLGHLSAHNSSPTSRLSSYKSSDFGSQMALYHSMGSLEGRSGLPADCMANQLVVEPGNFLYCQPYKTEPPDYVRPPPPYGAEKTCKQQQQQTRRNESKALVAQDIAQKIIDKENHHHQQQQQQQQQQQHQDTAELGEVQPHTCLWIDCNETLGGQEELVRHIERQHIDQRRADDFTCFWHGCQRRHKPFNARYKLLIHMRVHSGERPNRCTFENCQKAFSRLENLKIHLRSHTGERPYQCQHAGCTKAFSNSSDRAKHQRTHLDTKPYACQVGGCNKRYTDPSSLRKHTKSHANMDHHARKKVRTTHLVDYAATDCLVDCLSVQQVSSAADASLSPANHYQTGMRFGTGAMPAVNEPVQIARPSMNSVEEANHMIGGGFNPVPSGSLVTPGRRPVVSSASALPALHVTKMGMMASMPPVSATYREQPTSDTMWQPSPVPTPTPVVAEPTMPESSQQAAYSLPLTQGCAGGRPPMSCGNRLAPVSYLDHVGNAPIASDYMGLPCNLQERMSQPHASHFALSLEETLANLPYDAVQLQRALSNHSGSL